MYLVVGAFQEDFYLTSEDYYQQELQFEDQILATENAGRLESLPAFSSDQKNIYLSFEKGFEPESGSLQFYRPDNANLDATFELENGNTTIAKEGLVAGRYIAKIRWKKSDKSYYLEQEIRLSK